MKKKIFVNRDSRSGFRTSLKLLFWAAIGLVVLVLFIPLTSRDRVGRETSKKPAVEKGKVVKEIPRSLQPVAESLSRGHGEPSEPGKGADPRPATTPEAKGSAGMSAAVPAALSKEQPGDLPKAPPKAEAPAEGGQKSLAGAPPGPGLASSQAVSEVQSTSAGMPPPVGDEAGKAIPAVLIAKPDPAPPSTPEDKPKSVAAVPSPAKPAKPPAARAAPAGAAEPQKPAPAGSQQLYAVQVATVKDKRSAEELKKTLQQKGFEVVLKTTGDPKRGQSFTLQLAPVDSMGKASTMLEQVKYVPQAKPSIVAVGKE